MSLHFIENSGGNILEMEASGKLVASDLQSLESMFQRLVKQNGKIRVLFRMRDFHGWEPVALWDELKFDLKHFGDIKRLAIVGDKQWEKFLGVFGRPFTAAEIRYFDESALPAARVWLERNSI
jgi:SpoIIAA-like